MPKLKTHKGTARRMRYSGAGKLMRTRQMKSHLRRNKSKRTAGELDKRLGSPGAETLAAASGHDQRDGHRRTAVAHAAIGPRGVLPRARKPRYLAPATAIWLLAESASSSSR